MNVDMIMQWEVEHVLSWNKSAVFTEKPVHGSGGREVVMGQ